MNDSGDPADIERRLVQLRQEHRELDAEIARLVSSGPDASDELALKRLKKHKLSLKDCIARLQSALIPDWPA
ncbi:YdcH family protein [Lysobacter sp. A378]